VQWVRWLRGLDPLKDGASAADKASNNYVDWYGQQAAEYDTVPLWVRIYHSVRLFRWAILAAAILYTADIVNVSSSGVSQGVFLGCMFVVPFAVLVLFQLIHVLDRKWGPKSLKMQWSEGGTTPTWAPTRRPLRRFMQLVAVSVLVAAAILLIIFGAAKSVLTAGDVIELLMVFFIMLWMYARLTVVNTGRWLMGGARSVSKCYDIFMGAFILSVQMLFSLIPFGSSIHSFLLFSPGYAQLLEKLVGGRAGGGSGMAGGPAAAIPEPDALKGTQGALLPTNGATARTPGGAVVPVTTATPATGPAPAAPTAARAPSPRVGQQVAGAAGTAVAPASGGGSGVAAASTVTGSTIPGPSLAAAAAAPSLAAAPATQRTYPAAAAPVAAPSRPAVTATAPAPNPAQAPMLPVVMPVGTLSGASQAGVPRQSQQQGTPSYGHRTDVGPTPPYPVPQQQYQPTQQVSTPSQSYGGRALPVVPERKAPYSGGPVALSGTPGVGYGHSYAPVAGAYTGVDASGGHAATSAAPAPPPPASARPGVVASGPLAASLGLAQYPPQ
jgi:hypothetical protein